MPELKLALQKNGYENVSTVLNSGNVLFSSAVEDRCVLRSRLETVLQEEFSADIPVLVLTTDTLADILAHAPEWWGTDDKSVYDNLILLLTDETTGQLYAELGEPGEGLERVEAYEQVFYWSFDRAQYAKCRWWKRTAAAGIAERITIRTAGTIRRCLAVKES